MIISTNEPKNDSKTNKISLNSQPTATTGLLSARILAGNPIALPTQKNN
jgi:hypothetical protein